jgi:catechol 2,3-dioxygenase
MTVSDTTPTTTSIDAATQMGHLALTVADLERSVAFYTDAMGLSLLSNDGGIAVLGAGATPLLVLHERPGADTVPVEATGLYHLAILVPTRADLGRWLRHWLEMGFDMPGQGDHLVSEALYLADPDGNGIEIYRDRPRSEWSWENGQVRMATDPVDIRGVIEAGDREAQPWTGLPAGTTIGHVHLKVADIQRAAEFYHALFGFDIVAAMPSALFISAGGYHHHLGMNIWHSRNRGPAAETAAGLRYYTVEFASDEARSAVLDRLRASGIDVADRGTLAEVTDPFGITILLHVGPLSSQEAAAL